MRIIDQSLKAVLMKLFMRQMIYTFKQPKMIRAAVHVRISFPRRFTQRRSIITTFSRKEVTV